MLMVQVCVGSYCHLKGSHAIVEKLQAAISAHGLEDQVALAGSFCTGKCNRDGVTLKVNDEAFPGITPETFDDFFQKQVLDVIQKGA